MCKIAQLYRNIILDVSYEKRCIMKLVGMQGVKIAGTVNLRLDFTHIFDNYPPSRWHIISAGFLVFILYLSGGVMHFLAFRS